MRTHSERSGTALLLVLVAPLALLPLRVAGASEGLKERAAGLYVKGNPPPKDMPFIDHVVTGGDWEDFEPQDQVFQGPGWDRIDSALRNHPNLKLRIRIQAGRGAPSFVKHLGGPPMSGAGIDCSVSGGIAIVEPANNISSCVPYFWTDANLGQYAQLMREVARRYESNPRVLDVVDSACTTNFAEPFIRAGHDTESNLRLWLAGLNEATDRHCLTRSLAIHDEAFATTRVSLATHTQWQIVVDPVADANGVWPSWEKERELLNQFRARYGDKLVVQNNGLGGNETCRGEAGPNASTMWCWMNGAGLPKGFQTEGDRKLEDRGFTVYDAVERGIEMGACFIEHNQFGDDPERARRYDEQLKACSPQSTGPGYRMVASDGGIFAFGEAGFFGSTGGIRLARPIVAMGVTSSGAGYWLAAADGGIFAFGDAGFFGSTGGIKLAQSIVAMGGTPAAGGYWLAAADGGMFAFGVAGFFGSTGGIKLARPIVAMAATPSGQGYWLAAADGGIFAFGDAAFFGSTGAIRLNSPIVAMAAAPSGQGYWLAAADGGIFAFGDAAFFGSTGGIRLNSPIVAMAAAPSGHGYWLAAADGGMFAFGDAWFSGSVGGSRINRPIVALTPPRRS